MTRKIHIVSDREEEKVREDRLLQRKTLCGRKLIEEAAYMLCFMHPDTDMDALLEIRRTSILWSAVKERPFITVHEFVYEGDDTPDCWTCRKKLQKLLDADDF